MNSNSSQEKTLKKFVVKNHDKIEGILSSSGPPKKKLCRKKSEF